MELEVPGPLLFKTSGNSDILSKINLPSMDTSVNAEQRNYFSDVEGVSINGVSPYHRLSSFNMHHLISALQFACIKNGANLQINFISCCYRLVYWSVRYSLLVSRMVLTCKTISFHAVTDLSIAVPITNSLTMLITTLAGRILGEGKINAGI